MRDFDFGVREWFAQNEIWGTAEEESFLRFLDDSIEKLRERYEDISLLRNEQFFKIFSFEEGQPFAPDFVLFLKEKKSKKEFVYQVFIEPKGDQFLDANQTFKQSQEAWKQKFLLELESNYSVDLKLENKDFRLLGLPFYNEAHTKEAFEEMLEEKLIPPKSR
jgi:type III restriction enzyme